jgi:hypothetical protein
MTPSAKRPPALTDRFCKQAFVLFCYTELTLKKLKKTSETYPVRYLEDPKK